MPSRFNARIRREVFYGRAIELLMYSQNPSEAPDFVKGIVKWSRRDANDIGFAEIAFHTGGFELLQ